MKKIYFDSRWCGSHGIGRFASEIKKSKLPLQDIRLHGNPAGRFDVFKLTLSLFRLDGLFFSPGYNAPLLFLERSIITVHDLNHIDLSYNSSFLKKMYYSFVLKRACINSAKVLTVSEFSKDRIMKWSGVDADKVIVVGNGVSNEFNLNVKPYQPGFPYVFIVGNRKAHKNEVRALEAFCLAIIPKEIKLIFSGDISAELKKIIDKYNVNNRVLFSGSLSNDKLAQFYRGAEFLLFPSLYEGFGLPAIESMACGTAVITSNSTSLVEISGDAALLVNPESTSEITHAIEKLYNDIDYRNLLIKNGITRAGKYTWEGTVKKIEAAINGLL
ncbi:glycosyltransferase family 4 protein [Rahnella sp. SAP-1]|uniref:Glycosyltransferase family 4 protein n=1 Tax=Rouxiella aceris TaxID=2703884 RepID=A0A848MF62_9GAMM|nr:glycosyltransferase family 1 protein [Rouxiella aceris]NMP25682.1 glycosyltransferase family 4 protein [Rouxiella aceris]